MAIKIVLVEEGKLLEAKNEIRSMIKLEHPKLVKLLDYNHISLKDIGAAPIQVNFKDNTTKTFYYELYIEMEYFDHGTLEEFAIF